MNTTTNDSSPVRDCENDSNILKQEKQSRKHKKSRTSNDCDNNNVSLENHAATSSSSSTTRNNNNAATEKLTTTTTTSTTGASNTTTKQEEANNTTVYIGGIHPRIMKAHLEKMMLPYGKIERIHICLNEQGIPKGFAFCDYSDKRAAFLAIQALDGRALCGRRLLVREAHNNYNNNNNNSNTAATGDHHNNRSNNNHSNSNPNSITKQQRTIQEKIHAVKRKLQQMQTTYE